MRCEIIRVQIRVMHSPRLYGAIKGAILRESFVAEDYNDEYALSVPSLVIHLAFIVSVGIFTSHDRVETFAWKDTRV